MADNLVNFFAPRGVAVIGASANPGKISAGVLRNLTRSGYKGRVYPVNPRYPEIDGLPCYPDIASVPNPLDLAVIVLPARLTPTVLQACGRRGIKAAIIISGGFKEIGPNGAALQEECVAIARRHGIRLVGPNCVGTMDLYTGLNTTFLEGVPDRGHIGFLSQSGGVCGGVIDYIQGKHIGFSRFVSLGNEADITETDMIEFLAHDPNTRVIAVYVEAITDGCRFMQVARRVSRQKPIVMLKAGRTQAGGKAVSSHTGALAGSNAAYEAAFQQCGIIEAFSISELFDISLALACQPLPKGNRVFVLTNSGGPAALATDCLATQGMDLPDPAPKTVAALRHKLDPTVQIANPTDMLGGAGPAEYEFALQVVLSDPNIDSVLVMLVPHLLLNPTQAAGKICRVAGHAAKPIVTCFLGDHSVAEARRILHQHCLPMYAFPETAGRVLGAISRYAHWRRQNTGGPPPRLEVDETTAHRYLKAVNSTRTLGEATTRPMLEAYRIPVVAGRVARTPDEAVNIAGELGYPVVLKIVSPDILHKSDAGGVALNLADAGAVRAAYHRLVEQATEANLCARVEGVLVEATAPPGHEVIVGMRRDPQFGPLLMFGLGGIYVELLTDVSFRVAPVNRREALEMINETRAGKLLKGLRGRSAADIDAVVNCILHLSQLALDFPQIQEIEVNPLRVLSPGQGAVALDGRIILSPN